MSGRQWVGFLVALLLRSSAGAQFIQLPPVESRVFYGPSYVGLAAVDERTAYCYWNHQMVTASTITAVELSTGRLLWSKPVTHPEPPTFQFHDGWLLYADVDVEARADAFDRWKLHLVNANTGEQQILPRANRSRHSSVLSTPLVHLGHCVTSDGMVVRCSDGRIVGELGPGQHWSIVVDGENLLVLTTAMGDEGTNQKWKIRKIHVTTMNVMSETRLPLKIFSTLLAAKGDLVILACRFNGANPAVKSDDQVQLFCVDLSTGKELWRFDFPNAVFESACQWDENGDLIFSRGVQGIIRPIRIDVVNGRMAPVAEWSDPVSLLAWYHSFNSAPDFVATNHKYTIGCWQQLLVTCIDSHSGQLVWNHHYGDDSVGRFFTERTKLGDYLVVASLDRFSIVSTSTGNIRTILPADVGLTAAESPRPSPADINNVTAERSFLTSARLDRLKDALLLATPLLPFVIWLAWRFVRYQLTVRNGGQPPVR